MVFLSRMEEEVMMMVVVIGDGGDEIFESIDIFLKNLNFERWIHNVTDNYRHRYPNFGQMEAVLVLPT